MLWHRLPNAMKRFLWPVRELAAPACCTAGYAFGERLFGFDEIHAGTPYGASTYAGPTGARQPSELELDYAKFQGSYVAGVVKRLN